MDDVIKQEIESKKLFSISDVRMFFIHATGQPLSPELRDARNRMVNLLTEEAVSRIAKEKVDEGNMTPEAIYAKFRCDMYMRYMDYIDKGTTMSVEEAERWIDRATEFVMK